MRKNILLKWKRKSSSILVDHDKIREHIIGLGHHSLEFLEGGNKVTKSWSAEL